MNRGLLVKSAREAALVTVILAAGLLVVEGVFTFVLPILLEQLADQLLQLEFFRTMFSALFGAEIGDVLLPQAVSAIAWAHPVALTIVWAHAVISCTRLPAGEIERGTIDVLFGLPVSRWQVYAADSLVFAASGAVLLLCGLLGHCAGLASLEPSSRPGFGVLAAIVVNFFLLHLAVGGLARLVSAVSDRRGPAMGAVVAVLLASFLLNFLAQFWAPAEAVAFLGLLEYYRPLAVLQAGASGGAVWPLGDLAVLGGSAAALWIAGGVCFARRDLRTV